MKPLRMTGLWLGLLLALCGKAAAGAVEIGITLQLPPGSMLYESVAHFKAEVEKQARGGITVTIFPSAERFKPSEVHGAVASGAIEMGASMLTEYTEPVPASAIFTMPFMFASPVVMRGAVAPGSPIRTPIDEAILEKTSTRVLWWFPTGSSIMISHGAATLTPASIAGKKVRVSGVLLGEMVRLCGGTPLESGGDEQYALYKSGAVDIGMTSMSIVASRKLWEVMDTLTVTNHVPTEFVLVINEKVWQSLSPPLQQIVTGAARSTEQLFRQKAEVQARETLSLAGEHGMKVVEVSESDVKEWKDCATPMLADYLSRSGPLGARIMAGYRKVLVEAYRAPSR